MSASEGLARGATGFAETLTDPAAEQRTATPVVGAHPMIGRRLAHFGVEEILGRGGMGEVYRATDLALDRPVALKVLAPSIADDPALRARFWREARAQARIHHPNVCHIYYIGEEEQDRLLFFAMEYIEGETLAERLKRDGQMSAAEALVYCHMAAQGLREAERHGFTHRDIKPSNLMVDRFGVLKVLDFGIVKHASREDAGAEDDPTQSRRWAGGEILGTPLYMAPEQAQGLAVDFRSDVYSLGATLHHLIAGTPPFAGATPLGLLAQHVTKPRPRLPRRGRREESSSVDHLLNTMMAKRPEDRFHSYDELLEAVEVASAQHSRPAGFWVRALAVQLDFLVLGIIGLALGAPTHWLAQRYDTLVWLCVAAIYSIVCTSVWGGTLGKSILEIEVVRIDGVPRLGWRRAALRFFAEWGPAVTMLAVEALSAPFREASTVSDIVFAVLIGTSLAWPLLAGLYASSTRHRRAFWDRWAGTLVRYRRQPAPVQGANISRGSSLRGIRKGRRR
jgi:uncharacterized RDD family membrane protein YckC